jgi:hypothetical protein
MYVDKDLIVPVAEAALNMEVEGKEDWCIGWLEWFWQQEIERAVCDVKQKTS